MVEAVAWLDDEPFSDPHDDDARPGPVSGAAVGELADDHLGVGGVVDAHVVDANRRSE